MTETRNECKELNDSNGYEEGELDAYFKDGYWRLPYLMNGAGGFGGGVGEMKHETKEGVIQMYKDYHS